MASLLDLTSQGDVATITDDAYLNRTLQLMDPQQLYELWERQQWQSQGIDLERDKEQWAELPEDEKEEHLWGLSSFFVREERVPPSSRVSSWPTRTSRRRRSSPPSRWTRRAT